MHQNINFKSKFAVTTYTNINQLLLPIFVFTNRMKKGIKTELRKSTKNKARKA